MTTDQITLLIVTGGPTLLVGLGLIIYMLTMPEQVENRQLKEMARVFDLRWDADMRAIKLWQEAHPGNDLVWPDHVDLVVWLMEETETLENDLDFALEAAFNSGIDGDKEWVRDNYPDYYEQYVKEPRL